MSQHFYETTLKGKPVTVMMGFDRPLGHFFMVVEGDDEDRPIYSNLNDSNSFGHTLAYYQQKLQSLGISVPETMFSEVERDEAMCIGNRHVAHFDDGTFLE